MELKLVRWETGFHSAFYAQSNDEDLYNNMSDTFPKTPGQCEKMVEYFSSSDDMKDCVRAIQVDGKIAGCIGAFFESDIYCKNAELAYWIGRDYRGRGIVTEAIKQFTGDLFSHYDIVRIYARPFAHNTASHRVLEKAGFACEGTMRKSVWKNSRSIDALLYAFVRD